MAQITSQRHFRPMSRRAKLLKEKIGARGFEPPTSWSRTKRKTSISLSRLVPSCVLSHDSPRCSASFVPKMFPPVAQKVRLYDVGGEA
jgi:hypothetical protein